MKKFSTLLIVIFLLGANFMTNAQNLIENWDGNGAMGQGTSEAGNFGWVGTPAVTWGYAGQPTTIRYIDNPGYTFQGTPWSGRILSIRWDNVGGSTTSTVFAYPVTLEASKTYLFSGKIAWNSNSSGTSHFAIGLNSAADNSGTYLHTDTVTITDLNRLKLYEDTFKVVPTTSGTYYLTFTNNLALMGAVGDLSIVEKNPCYEAFQTYALTLTGLTNIMDGKNATGNIALPAGTGNVTITWASSHPDVISNTGIVTRPDKFNFPVILNATLTAACGASNYTKGQTFSVFATAVNPPPTELLARWNFATSNITFDGDTVKVRDNSGNNLVGKLVNEASIRTIGSTTKYNVLDLGNNTGYFDMGKEIGKAVYSLLDYSIGVYFYIDNSYTDLNSAGNFLWMFSNSADPPTDRNGYMIGTLRNQDINITTAYSASGNKSLSLGANAPKGSWHHFAYTQQGDSGKIYIDGKVQKRGIIEHKPSLALPKPGLKGTLFNWIGRSYSSTDVYLRKTLVYDFRLISATLSQGDMEDYLDVTNTLAALNLAYAQKANDTLPELKNEWENLTLGDLSAITSNITLPSNGTLDPSIAITWASSNTTAISNSGVVTRKDYLNTSVVLTATLAKGGQKVSKDFTVTVLPNTGTGYTSDLLLNYNFATVNGATVTDAAEKHFTGTLLKGANVMTIGPAGNRHKVLNLASDSSYFNMGTECGKLIYGLNDYSVSVYFLIDRNKTNFSKDGNFIYTFSNSDSSGTAKNGYMFGRASYATHCVSSQWWQTGNMATTGTSGTTSLGAFHHFVYTQNGTIGTSYLDGKVISASNTFTNLLSTAVAKSGFAGTLYNWLGRSSYVGDAYLSKALLANFQLYRKTLTQFDVDTMQVKAANLNLAYANDSVPELINEKDNLKLGDLSAVVSDIVLPANGTLDPSIVITWKSSNPAAISATGVVNRPDYIDAQVVLTASLMKNGIVITKTFIANVVANPGTGYASDLLLNYNFADNLVSGTTITDAGEKRFTGTLKKGATVSTIGPADNKHNVLNLGVDSSYFDMGIDCGKLMYSLGNYSISVYFLIDPAKTNFSNNGNFIYTFSNSDSSDVRKNGYIFGRATNAVHCVSSQYFLIGSMQTKASTSESSKGAFHHLVFTQNGSVGTTYLDGDTVSSVATFTNLPSLALPKDGLTGTLYNWLGRSSYKGDAYLAKAMVADFKLYKKVLTGAEVKTMQTETSNLTAAYNNKTSVEPVKAVDKLIIDNSVPGLIQIRGIKGNEKVAVFDLLGRSIAVQNKRAICVKSGIYIVKVDNKVAKVWVK